MFHLFFGLLVIGLLVIVVSVLLFSIVTIAAGLIGGTSAALLIKNKTSKRLLLIGFCIMFFIGLLCLIPLITAFASLPTMFFSITSVFICICIIMLTIAGIKLSKSIEIKIGKTVLLIVFCIILIVAIFLIIFTFLASHFLL